MTSRWCFPVVDARSNRYRTAPETLADDARRSLLASDRSPRTPIPMMSPTMAITTMISMSVNPPVRARLSSQFPGLDVVGGTFLLVLARRDHVGVVGVVG